MSNWLTVTRKPGQHLRVGDVVIWIGKSSVGSVRVGVYAPNGELIERGEKEKADYDGLITRAKAAVRNPVEIP